MKKEYILVTQYGIMIPNNITVVIPVFRGSENVLKSIVERFKNFSEKGIKIIFVFDGGKKESLEALEEVVLNHQSIKVIELSKNFGQHNAIICGIEHAKGDWIITMDEDFQHDPLEIPKLFEKQKEGDYDVVYGKYHELSHSWFRNFTSILLKKLLKIGIPNLHSDFTAFRLIKTRVAKKLVGMNNSYTFLDGYLSWITSSVSSVLITHSESKAGESSYSLKKLIEHSINIFVTFSNLPIRILSISAFFFILLSSSYSLYIIISSFTNANYQAGFPTFIAFLGFGFGLVLFGLGVVGEYIARINYKTTNRPNYSVKKIIEHDTLQ